MIKYTFFKGIHGCSTCNISRSYMSVLAEVMIVPKSNWDLTRYFSGLCQTWLFLTDLCATYVICFCKMLNKSYLQFNKLRNVDEIFLFSDRRIENVASTLDVTGSSKIRKIYFGLWHLGFRCSTLGNFQLWTSTILWAYKWRGKIGMIHSCY